MTTLALLTAADAKRLARAADESGCTIIVERGDATITITPIRNIEHAEKSQMRLIWTAGESNHAAKASEPNAGHPST